MVTSHFLLDFYCLKNSLVETTQYGRFVKTRAELWLFFSIRMQTSNPDSIPNLSDPLHVEKWPLISMLLRVPLFQYNAVYALVFYPFKRGRSISVNGFGVLDLVIVVVLSIKLLCYFLTLKHFI